MAPARFFPYRAFAVGALSGLLLVAFAIFVVPNPSYSALLTQTGGGSFTEASPTGTLSFWYVNLTLRLDPSGSLNADTVSFAITAPNGLMIQPNGYPPLGRTVELVYTTDTNPAWLTALPGGGESTSFTAVVANPDGSMVGGLPPLAEPVHGWATTVDSGAVISITFPGGVDPSGYELAISSPVLSAGVSLVAR